MHCQVVLFYFRKNLSSSMFSCKRADKLLNKILLQPLARIIRMDVLASVYQRFQVFWERFLFQKFISKYILVPYLTYVLQIWMHPNSKSYL